MQWTCGPCSRQHHHPTSEPNGLTSARSGEREGLATDHGVALLMYIDVISCYASSQGMTQSTEILNPIKSTIAFLASIEIRLGATCNHLFFVCDPKTPPTVWKI